MKTRLLVTLLLAAGFAGSVASATTIHFRADLDGASEAPPNASAGWGTADVYMDDVAHTMRIRVSFAGLSGVVTASHIHAATAEPFTGVAQVATQTPTLLGFPAGVTSGSYDHLFDMTLASSYRSAYLANFGGSTGDAEAGLLAAMLAGKAYLNIHTNVYPAGEIRGFLRVPDAGATAPMLLGAFALVASLARFPRRAVASPAV